MAKDFGTKSGDKIAKRVEESLLEKLIPAVKNAASEAEKEAAKTEINVNPKVKVNTKGIEASVNQQVDRAIADTDVKASINIGKLFTIDIEDLKRQFLAARRELDKVTAVENAKVQKEVARNVLTIGRVAQLRGIKQVPINIQQQKSVQKSVYDINNSSKSITTAKLIGDIVEDFNISDKQLEKIENAIARHHAKLKQEAEMLQKDATEVAKAYETVRESVAESMKKTSDGDSSKVAKQTVNDMETIKDSAKETVKVLNQAVEPQNVDTDAMQKQADSVTRSQKQIRDEIEYTNRVISTSKERERYLGNILDKDYSATTRPAAQLKSAASEYIKIRHYPKEYEHEEYASDRINVEYWRAMEVAKQRGLSDKTLLNNSRPVSQENYEASLAVLEQRRIERQQILQKATQKLISLQEELARVTKNAGVGDDSTTKPINEVTAQAENLQSELKETSNVGGQVGKEIAEGMEIANTAISEVIQQLNTIDSISKERFSLINSKTGYYTDPNKHGDYDFISEKLINDTIKNAESPVDTLIHTHPERMAAFSYDDIYIAIDEMSKGIIHQYIKGIDEVAYIDFSQLGRNTWKQIAKNFEKSFNKLVETDGWVEGTETPEIKDAFEKKTQDTLKQIINMQVGKGSEFADSLYKIFPISNFLPSMSDSVLQNSSKSLSDIQQEVELHTENTQAIKEEIEAKKESQALDNKPKIELTDAEKEQLNNVHKIAEEKRQIYEDEKARIAQLQAQSDYMKDLFDSVAGYQEAKIYTKRYQLSPDELYKTTLDHYEDYQQTGDEVDLGKAASYYESYVAAMKKAKQEIQAVVVDSEDLSSTLLNTAASFGEFGSVDRLRDKLTQVNRELFNSKENLKTLEQEALVAEKASVEQKAQDERFANLYDQWRESSSDKAEEVTANLEKQGQAAEEAAESEQKLADAEKEVEKAAQGAADAKAEEAKSDNSEAVKAEEEETEKIEKKTKARKKAKKAKDEEQESSNNQAVANEQEQLEATEKRTQKQRELNDAIQEGNAIQNAAPSEKPDSTTEDLQPLINQLENVKRLIGEKNELFEKEISLVTKGASDEAKALEDVGVYLDLIKEALLAVSDKGFNFNFKGIGNLKKLTELDVDKIDDRLIETFDHIQDFATALSHIRVDDKSFMVSINNMLKDGEKLKNLAEILKASKKEIDNATEATGTNSSTAPKAEENLVKAYDNALNSAQRFYELRHMNRTLTDDETKELERLWTTWKNLGDNLDQNIQKIEAMGKSTKKAYEFGTMYRDDAGYKQYVEKNTPKPTPPPKIDLTEWKEALKLSDEYYKLQSNDKRTASEETRLNEIKSIWDSLYQKVQATTTALQAQGQSVKVLDDFVEAYNNGLQKYQTKIFEQKQAKSVKDINNAFEGFSTKINDYPKKYTEELKKDYNELANLVNQINAKPVDAVTQEEISDTETLINKLRMEFNSAEFRVANQTKISNLENEISKYIDTYTGLSKARRDEFEALKISLKDIGDADALQNAIIQFNKLRVAAREAGEETKSFWTKVGEQISHANAQLIGMYFSWQDLIRYVREAGQAVIEVDTALAELRKVSDASTDRLNQSFETSASTAKELGNTISNVINQTADWSRIGYSVDDAEKLARVTTLFQTVGDNMTAESASNAMISTLKAYEMGVDQAEDIVDKYNIIANNFSIDTQGLATGIEKAGGALKAASNSFSESLALITAGNASLQDPASVSQLLKTMSMRLNGASAADLEALGIDTTGMSQGKKSIIQQYKHMAGIDIMEGTNYKSTFRILDELYEKWDSLTMAERQAIAEASGGKRAGSVFASLMTNWEDAREVVKKAEESFGSAEKEQENYAKSIQYSIDKTKASLEELSKDFLSSDLLKGLIESGNKFINILDIILKKSGGLSTVLGIGTGIYATKQGFNVKEIYSYFSQVSKQISQFNSLNPNAEGFAKAKAEIIGTNKALGQYLETTSVGSATLQGFGQHLATVTLGEKAAALAATALSAAFQALTSIAITWAISTIVSELAKVSQAEEEARQSAIRLANEYQETSKELDDYIDKYQDLNQKLKEAGEDEEAVRAIKEQLVGIQQDLNDKYGVEYEKVNLVNGKYEEQLKILQGISKEKAQDYISTNRNEYEKANEYLDTQHIFNFGELTQAQRNAGLDKWLEEKYGDKFISNYESMRYDPSQNPQFIDEWLKSKGINPADLIPRALDEDINEWLQLNGLDTEELGLSRITEPQSYEIMLSSDFEDADEFLRKLYSEIETYGEEHSIDVSDVLNNISIEKTKIQDDDKLSGYKAVREQYIKSLIASDDELSDSYEKGLEAVENYNKALASGEGVEAALANLNTVKNQINSIDFNNEGVKKSFDSIWDGIDVNAEKLNRLDNIFNGIIVEPAKNEVVRAKETIKEEIESIPAEIPKPTLGNFFDDLFSKDTPDKQFQNITGKVTSEAEKSVEDIKLVEESFDDLVAKIKEFNLSEVDFTSGFDSLPKDVIPIIDTFLQKADLTRDDLDALKDKLIEVGVVASDTIEDIKEESLSLSSSDMANTLVKNYDKAFKAIGAAYKDIAEKDFDVKQLDLSSITAIKDELSSMNANSIEVDTSGYEKLLATLTNVKSTEAEIKDAFSNMASTLVNSITKIDEGNVEVAESFLRSNGVVDASLGSFMAYCNSLDETAAKSKGLIDANGNIIQSAVGISSSADNASSALVEEMYSGENTTNALKYLQLSMIAVASQGIDVSGQIDSLKSLAGAAIAAGVAVKQATGLQNASKELERAEAVHGKDSAYYKAVLGMTERKKGALEEEVNKELTNLQNGLTIDLSKVGGGGSGSGKGKGGGGGGSKKDKEEEKDILAELSKQLDEIQEAYKSLNEIVEAYNANGKLTVDQAQALINTDFRYLALLTDQNGQLKLNEQGFQDLAKAKIQEMQIQLARNAIDTINSFEDEAKAVDYLTYAYEGLKGAALDATEAQLQAAVAAAKARGAAQGSAKLGEAAERVYEGYLATKQAIGNTDFSSASLQGDSKDKDQSSKDKSSDKSSKKEEETKTRFNWLEKLVHKIQRSIDKIANRIDKYFTYQSKNALVDKQLAANRKMIGTQELAVDYYQNKAAKALKKVPKKYRKLVSGDFDAATVKKLYADVGEKGTKKLQTYLEWQSLLESSQDTLEAAYDSERELITSKLDNILSYFDTLIGYQENIVSSLETSIKLDEAKGKTTDINKLLATYSQQKEIVDTSGDREKAYEEQASKTADAIRDSYNSQISETETGYQDTTTYQKLKGKKGKKAKAALNSQYQVLAEDVDAFVKANKTYEAGKNKKSSSKKYQKAMEAKATMDRLHQKYTDYVNQLRTEQQEALEASERELEDQKLQNKINTDNAEINRWDTIHQILNQITGEYDNQIKRLNTMVEKYATLAELVGTIDEEVLKSYDVKEIFGNVNRARALSEAYTNTRNTVGQYKEQYQIYDTLISAAKRGGNAIATEVEKLLGQSGLTSESKEIVKNLAEDLRSKGWTVDDTWVQGWQESQNEAQKGITDAINNAEDYMSQLLNGILESSKKEVEKLTIIADRFGTIADLLNEFDDSILAKYGVGDVYTGTRNKALTDAINATRSQINVEKQQYDLYGKLIAAFGEGSNANSRTRDLYSIIRDANVDEESKDYVREIINKINQGVPIGTNDDLDEWRKAQQQNMSNISSEIKKAEGYLTQISENLVKASEKEITNLTSLIERFETVADLLGDVNYSVLKGYGVENIFGNNRYAALAQEITNSREKANVQKTAYTIYDQLANAFAKGSSGLDSRLRTILSNPNLTAEQRDAVNELLANYKSVNTEDERKRWETERDRVLGELSSTIKKSEETLQQIFTSIIDSSNKEVEMLNNISEKFSAVSDILSTVNSNILKRYGINGMFGNERNAVEQGLSATSEAINKEKLQYALYGDIIEALKSNNQKVALQRLLSNKELTDEAKQAVQAVITALQNGTLDTEKYVDQFTNAQSESLSKLNNDLRQVEDYTRRLAELITETTNKLIESFESLQSVYTSKASVLNDDWLIDVNGLTEFGYARVDTLAKELGTSKNTVDALYKNIEALQDQKQWYIDNLGEEEYNKAFNEALAAYYSEIANAQTIQNQIYELSQKAMNSEIESIQKLVDNYKKALNAKKSYYDYNKTLREKNKNIQNLTAEIRALQDVETATGKAKLKSLQAELQEAQEDLEDTVFEHTIQVESDALDDLIQSLNETIENSTKTIQEIVDDFTSSVQSLIQTSEGYDADQIYSKAIDIATAAKTSNSGYTGTAAGSTTVSDDIASGQLTPITTGTVAEGYNQKIIDILSDTNKLVALQTQISGSADYLPGISTTLKTISGNVGNIDRSTAKIFTELVSMNGSVNQLVKNVAALRSSGTIEDMMLRAYQKAGLTRVYK